MSRFIDIISPIYQEFLSRCERKKITVNLDIQDLTVKTAKSEPIVNFYSTELKRALKMCEPGDKITIAQTVDNETIRLSVKNSSRTLLEPDIVEKLRNDGHEVRSRFGYDTIISLKIEK